MGLLVSCVETNIWKNIMLNVYRTVYITLDNSKIKLEKINTWSSTKNMRDKAQHLLKIVKINLIT